MFRYVPRFLLIVIGASFFSACTPSKSPSEQINPYRQAEIDDAKSLIGKKIWVPTFGLTLCDTPTCITGLDSSAASFDQRERYLGPLNVKDVLLPAFNISSGLYIVVNTVDGNTKYWYAISSRPSHDVLFEDPKVTSAHKKATCDKKGGVSIGMTEAEVLASCWGKPHKKNITDIGNNQREQWVYGKGSYLYFSDGVLSGIQTSR